MMLGLPPIESDALDTPARRALEAIYSGSAEPLSDALGPSRTRLGAAYSTGAEAIRRLMPQPKVMVYLTREMADAARLAMLPQHWAASAADDGDDDVEIAWGSAAEAVEASLLPAHLQRAVLMALEAAAVRRPLPEAEEGRVIDHDDLIGLLCDAWLAERRQQAIMLREHFERAASTLPAELTTEQSSADGLAEYFEAASLSATATSVPSELTLPQLWSCLHKLLRRMVASGGESARVAEPWMGSGACEQLYHQLLVESEFRQQGLRSGSVEREAFVAVLLRRRLVDSDWSSFLERHPEEVGVLG